MDLTYKICVFGESKVGKTSLIERFTTNRFFQNTKPTLGASIHVKHLEFDKKKIIVQIWDFGGEERFRFLLPSYAAGAFGGIYMFDITRKETLENFDEWIKVFKSGLSEDKKEIPILLVGGKSDLENERACEEEDIQLVYNSGHFFDMVEGSAKIDENVDKIFRLMLDEIIKRFKTKI